MSIGIFRAIRWVVGLLVAVILLGICALFVAERLGAFDDFCMMTPVDHVEIVDELREGDQTLYLVYRVSGWAEKIAFYQLYSAPPNFNVCGNSKEMSLDMDAIEDDGDWMVKDVLVRDAKQYGMKLEIRYTRQADEGVLPTQAKLIRGDPLTYESNCETRFPADHVEVVDKLHTDDQALYLVYRVMGFRNKKAGYYELYATLPSFDVCGDSKDKRLDMHYIEDDGDRWVKDVLVRNTKKHGPMLEIRYTRQANEGVSLNQAKLIRADGLELNPEDHPRLWDAENTGNEGTMETGHN